MKRTKKMAYGILILILICFPLFFRKYPELRFYWGILSAIGIGVQVFFVVSNKLNTEALILGILLLLLSDGMAYDIGNWEFFASAFPMLAGLSQWNTVLLIVFVMLGIGILAAVIVKCLDKTRSSGRRYESSLKK
jgi:hypothetical protein